MGLQGVILSKRYVGIKRGYETLKRAVLGVLCCKVVKTIVLV